VDISIINNFEMSVHDKMIMKSRLHFSNISNRDRGNRRSQYRSKIRFRQVEPVLSLLSGQVVGIKR
jgi:hypothetical protein